jgi:type I restriction enzyme S subunit
VTVEWKTISIGDLCKSGEVELQTGPFGSQLHSYDYLPEGVPVVPTEAIADGRLDHSVLPKISSEKAASLGRHALRTGDILFARRGVQATGKTAMVRAHEAGFICGTGAIRLRVKSKSDKLDAFYLACLLADQASIDWFKFHAIGATMPNLNEGIIKAFHFSLAPLPEQRTIAATLGALGDKIELNRKMNETLEAMARALFRDWFVDFGPTRAKMDGRPAYLAEDLWSLFPDRLDEECKPEGWEARPLADCFNLLMGQSPPGDTYNDDGEGLPFFQGRTDFGFRFPENRKYCSAPTRVAEKDDTLVSVRAPVGDINLAAERCCIGRGVAALRHKSGGASFTYYTAWSLQDELQQFENTGTVFGAINKVQFEKLPTVDPKPAVIEAFENIVSALDKRIENNECESRTLAQTRDLLLPRLMSGEIRVREAEQIIEEAL